MRRTCIIAWILCSAVLKAAETPLYRADFSSPLGADWQVLDGRVSVEGGRLTVRSDRSHPLVRLNRTFHGDLSIRLRLIGGPGSHWSGVVVKDTWWLALNNEFAAVLLVRRRSDKPQEKQELARTGNWTAFVEDPHDFELRLDCQGSKLRAFLDGLLAAEVEDPEAPEGGGLALVGGWGTDAACDDLMVRQFDPTMLPKPRIVPPASTLGELRAELDRRDAIYGDDRRCPSLTLPHPHPSPRLRVQPFTPKVAGPVHPNAIVAVQRTNILTKPAIERGCLATCGGGSREIGELALRPIAGVVEWATPREMERIVGDKTQVVSLLESLTQPRPVPSRVRR